MKKSKSEIDVGHGRPWREMAGKSLLVVPVIGGSALMGSLAYQGFSAAYTMDMQRWEMQKTLSGCWLEDAKCASGDLGKMCKDGAGNLFILQKSTNEDVNMTMALPASYKNPEISEFSQ